MKVDEVEIFAIEIMMRRIVQKNRVLKRLFEAFYCIGRSDLFVEKTEAVDKLRLLSTRRKIPILTENFQFVGSQRFHMLIKFGNVFECV